MNYFSLLLDAMSWAREAGAVHLRYFRGNELDIQSKLNDSDVVTAADKAAEKVLIDHIKASCPDHSILSEESGEEAHCGEYRWVIDPLDGTTNFSQGLPLFSVSIGIEHNGETVVGVVFAPYLNELFHAVKGQGRGSTASRLRYPERRVLTGVSWLQGSLWTRILILTIILTMWLA